MPITKSCSATNIRNFSIEDSDWDTFPWQEIPSELIGNYMGEKPCHFPKTEVKIAYDSSSISLMFRVEDRYVCAKAANHQDNVYKDSCVEFFFTPGTDVSKGYFNIEMNCGGTMLFHFQLQPRKNPLPLPLSDCSQITCVHSQPRIVDPEITEQVVWTVAYRIPITILEKYTQVSTPAPQTSWRVNFYKCADDSSHPHWLTWAPIDLPKPNFHHPQSFGILEFS